MASALGGRDFMLEDEEEETFTKGDTKVHNIAALGISDLTSVEEFKIRCASELRKCPYSVGTHPVSDSNAFLNNLASEMRITRTKVRELKVMCK